MTFHDLPAINASLNGLSALFLTIGYCLIRQGKVRGHRNCMAAAVCSSTVFLACYLTYHFFAGRTNFRGEGWVRPLYFTILLSHTFLAVAVVPMVLLSLTRVWKKRFKAHRQISRWTWPIWMYVSVTGVVIYLMLYHLYPSR